MAIGRIYTPPFPAVEHTRETAMAELSVTVVQLAMKLIVAQFCRAKDHESIKVQSVCSQKT